MFRVFLFVGLVLVLNASRAQKIDTKHVLLDLHFDWEREQAAGTAEIRLQLLEGADQLFLDAGFLSITEIKAQNQHLKFHCPLSDSAKNLRIFLGKTFKKGSEITLHIAYHTNHENRSDPMAIGGSFGKGLRFFGPTQTTPTKRKQLWSSGQPNHNKYWFPGNEDISDIHSTEIHATVPKPLTAISNGKLVNIKDNGNFTRTFHYQSAAPFPHYLVFIAAGEYQTHTQKAGKSTINTFGYPDEMEAVKATTEWLPDMLQFLESKTSMAYPFPSYSQVVVQDYPFPGRVGQNAAALLSDNYIDDFGVHKDYKYLWDGVAVQALTNQWFGNLLMPKSWQDIWLSQGFAQYFAGLYTTRCFGKAEYLLWYYPFEWANATGEWANGNIHPICPKAVTEPDAFTNDAYSNYRAALVLRMLQMEMGEANWWKALQFFVKNNAHKQVSTLDFQKAVENISGKSYQWFFDQWIYNVGMPKLEIKTTYEPISKELKLHVSQSERTEIKTHYPLQTYFGGKVAIEVDGKMDTVSMLAQKENDFTFKNRSNPQYVLFNAGQTWLCENESKPSIPEAIAILKMSSDAYAKKETINQLVAASQDSSTSSEVKNEIRKSLETELDKAPYWRSKLVALGALGKLVTLPLDQKMVDLLNHIIQNSGGFLKAAAINLLGNSADSSHLEIYKIALHDSSDRVVNAAAIAIGKTKSSKALSLLLGLEKMPSWKNQNRISALNGLQQLGDTLALPYVLQCLKDNQSSRWFLATPTWDYPFAAVNTLLALGKADLAYPLLLERFKNALKDRDINDIFQLVQLINRTNDKRAIEIYPLLKEKFTSDPDILQAAKDYENQYLEQQKP